MLVVTSLSELEPDLAHIQDEMLYLAFGALNNVHHLNKGKNVICQTTLHSASQLLFMFSAFWPIEDTQLYVLCEQWPLVRCPPPNVHCMQFLLECSLTNRLGWTFIY